MRLVFLRAFAAIALTIASWSVGLAQGSKPAFELVVTSGNGFPSVKCATGCFLTYLNEAGRPTASDTFTLECKDGKPCSTAAKIAGELRP